MAALGGGSERDPLLNLREYRRLAPWNLRDLAALTAAMLDAAGVRPINAAASAHPSERTIRFYVTRSLVASPEGRGTAATYGYRHLLEVLAIKLRQMEGGTLAAIAEELRTTTGDVLERRVAASLGPGLPPPTVLPLYAGKEQPRGRAGQVLRVPPPEPPEQAERSSATWRRLPVTEGIELHVRDDHALASEAELQRHVAEAVRLAIHRLLSPSRPLAPRPAARAATERTEHHA
jgi:hypothetical protein